VADNDYAVGLLVQRCQQPDLQEHTLIFVVEDDAQDGGTTWIRTAPRRTWPEPT